MSEDLRTHIAAALGGIESAPLKDAAYFDLVTWLVIKSDNK